MTDYLRAVSPGTSAPAAAQLQKEADEQLRAALPLAADANSDDGSWNALMTTISEGATVDEGHLVPSLRAQCVVADANANVNPQSPTYNQSPNSDPAAGEFKVETINVGPAPFGLRGLAISSGYGFVGQLIGRSSARGCLRRLVQPEEMR